MTAFWITAGIVALLASIVAHEAAHALVLRKLGIPIREAGLGLPLPPVLVYIPKRLPFRVAVSPWLLGAYVEPDPAYADRIEKLPYRDYAWFTGAGVVINLVLAGGFGALSFVLQGQWWLALAAVAGAALLWFGRKVFAAYIIPILGLPALAYIAYALVKTLGDAVGVVGAFDMFSSANSLATLTWIVMGVNISLGVMNLIPIYPLDGGRITGEIVRRYCPPVVGKVFRGTGMVVMLGLLGYVIVSDVLFGF